MKTASKVAEETLVATQRPWVSVKLAIGPRGLFFDANGANLDLNYSLKNTGPTPAVTVRVVGSPRIDVGTNDRITEVGKVCDKARREPQNPKMLAQTIFPGEILDLNFTDSFANKEFLDLTAEKRGGSILPVVLGCVDYFFTFGEPIHHQSRFVYVLDYPTPSGGSRAIEISDGDKSADVLRLTRWFEGGSFQAD